jgi:CubicO group peptidase (beta-lactamase class C family)
VVALALAAACADSDPAPTAGDSSLTSESTESTVSTAPAPTSAPPTTAAPSTSSTTEPITTTSAVPGLDLPIAAGLPPLPPQPDGVPFPTVEWPLGSLPADDTAAIDALVDEAFDAPPNVGSRSLLIVIGGKVVYERHRDPDTADTIMDSWSVGKSFTSALVGIAAGDGLIDVSGRALRPEWDDPADPRHAITVADLLHMSSGLDWTEGPSYAGFFPAPSGAGYAAAQPLAVEPNTLFNYSTGTTAILASLVAREVGGAAQLEEYVRERLLDPIGATSTQLLKDPEGMWYGGLGANTTVRDFARFGLLFLRDGVWDGERILPEGWVDYSRTPSDTSPIYGAQWWLAGDGSFFEAQGLYGQIIRVVPALDAVIVTTTFSGGNSSSLVATVQDLLES